MAAWFLASVGGFLGITTTPRRPSRRRFWCWRKKPVRSADERRSPTGCSASPAAPRSKPGPRGPNELPGRNKWNRFRRCSPPDRTTGQNTGEIEALLDAGLSRLPEKYRLAVVLCDLEGKSHREVGHELGCPEATVSSRVMRARTMLAKWFGRQGFVLSIGAVTVLLSRQSASASLPAALVTSTAKGASLSALGQPIAASVTAPHVVGLAKGVLKSMLFTTLKGTAAALVVLIAIGVVAGGLVHWLQAAERPATELKTQPIVRLPEPLDLLAKYEKALVPYDRMKGLWTYTVSVGQAGEKPQLKDEAKECTVLRDGGRARLVEKTTGGERKTPRLWEELLQTGKHWVAASNDSDVMTGKLETSADDLPERVGLARSSPGFGVIDGQSIPAFLHKSQLSVRVDTLDGNACFALRGVGDDRDITVWVDPALNYVARRVLFNKRSTPSDPTIRTCQFEVKRFQNQASGPVVMEATNTLTIGPQPIFQSVGIAKVVNGKTIIETPLLPAKGADGKILMQPATICRWEVHTVACDLDPHFQDADFRMTVPIKNGTRISMSDAPMLQYIWKDGAVQAGGWSNNLSLYKTGERKPRWNASRVRFEMPGCAACPCCWRPWGTRPNRPKKLGQAPRLRGVERQSAVCADHAHCRRSACGACFFRPPRFTPAKSWRNPVGGI